MTEDVSDRAARRRLLLAQGILERGEALSNTGDPLDRMLSLHLLHLAVETAVRALAIKLGVPGVTRGRQVPLSDLLGQIQAHPAFASTGKSLYSPDLVAHLNEKRNATQHTAEPVDPSILEESRGTARSFLTRLYADFFSARLGSLTELDFIVSDGIRRLVAAARLLNDGSDGASVAQAFGALNVAFHRGLDSWFRDHRRSLVTSYFAPFGNERDIHVVANELETVVALLSTGVSPLDYRSFARLCPFIATLHDGMNHVEVAERDGVVRDKDSYPWAERFVVGAVLKWQQAGLSPSIDAIDGAVKQFEELASVGGTEEESEVGA